LFTPSCLFRESIISRSSAPSPRSSRFSVTVTDLLAARTQMALSLGFYIIFAVMDNQNARADGADAAKVAR
jgi:hypothetical protein